MPAPPGNNQVITENLAVPAGAWTNIGNPNGARTIIISASQAIWWRIDEAASVLPRGFPLPANGQISITKKKPPGYSMLFDVDATTVALQVMSQGGGALADVHVYWIRE